MNSQGEYLHAEEKRRRDREVKMQYKWEERIKKGMDKGKHILNMPGDRLSFDEISKYTGLVLKTLR